MAISHYTELAMLFDYPEEGFGERVKAIHSLLSERYPEAAKAFERFAEVMPQHEIVELQELYMRTFEVQAITTLGVGYTVFGDDYKRGVLLANLNGEHRRAENPCAGELADHLPNVLRLLPLLNDRELLDDLVAVVVAPGVREMAREFNERRLASKDLMYRKHQKTVLEQAPIERTIYGCVLNALYEVLRADFDVKEVVRMKVVQNSTFLQSIGTEMRTENDAECSA